VGDLTVSTTHAIIERDGDGCFIEDAGATHGTIVSHQLLAPGTRHQLSTGEHVTLGDVDLIYLDAGAFFFFVKRFLGV